MTKKVISSYVLTHVASPDLSVILQRLARFSDEVLVVDSGGLAEVARIARDLGCSFHYRQFDDFVGQRTFATGLCEGDYVFFCDSDEVPSLELVDDLLHLKEVGFGDDLYSVRRSWHAFGRPVRAVYPVVSPDYPVRLARRSSAVFEDGRLVHERYVGHLRARRIESPLLHYTFATNAELLAKLRDYSVLEAKSVRRRSSLAWYRWKQFSSPVGAFFQWYLGKGGIRDGAAGLKLSAYAAATKYQKYRLAGLHAANPEG